MIAEFDIIRGKERNTTSAYPYRSMAELQLQDESENGNSPYLGAPWCVIPKQDRNRGVAD